MGRHSKSCYEIFPARDDESDANAPRLRIYRFDGPSSVVGPRKAQAKTGEDGAIRVEPDEKIVHLHSAAATKQVPFITATGTAQPTEAADREAGAATDEVLYVSTFNGVLVVMHAITPPGDVDGMRRLEEVIRGFKFD